VAEQTVSAEAVADHLHIRSGPLAILAAAALVVVLREGAPVLAPILLSVLLAYALEPFVRAVMWLRVPRLVAAIVVYAALGAAAIGLERTATGHVDAFLRDLPRTLASMRSPAKQRTDDRRPGPLDRIQEAIKHLQEAANATAPAPPPDVHRVVSVPARFRIRNYLLSASAGVVGVSLRFIAIALLTFLLVTAGDLLKRKAITIAGPRLAERKLTLEVIKSIDRQIERYLMVRVLISAIVATLTATALWVAGMNHPGVWGVIAGMLNVIPFIGPSIACAAITSAAALQFHAVEPTLLVAAAAVGIAVLEGNLISPWLTSRAGDLNTVAVFVSILFWGWTWDMWGLVLAVPITVALKAAADQIEELRPLGELLGR
jgi:predicted PurR-regulated permease PerM